MAADAIYPTTYAPWSIFLTGESGLAPKPFYDPLAFAVAESHARGMQLHAWINPFRAGNTADTAKLAANHVFNTRRTHRSRRKPTLHNAQAGGSGTNDTWPKYPNDASASRLSNKSK